MSFKELERFLKKLGFKFARYDNDCNYIFESDESRFEKFNVIIKKYYDHFCKFKYEIRRNLVITESYVPDKEDGQFIIESLKKFNDRVIKLKEMENN